MKFVSETRDGADIFSTAPFRSPVSPTGWDRDCFVCCFTPALVYGLGAFGLSAALAWVDIVLLPVFGLSLGLLGVASFCWWRGREDANRAGSD